MTVEAVLDLDIAGALRDVGRLEASLTDAADEFQRELSRATATLKGLTVDIDTTAVARDMAAALGRVPAFTVDVDEPEITASVERALKAVRTDMLSLDVDVRRITQAIERAIAAADTSVNVTGTASDVTAAINRAVAAANTNVTVRGTADVGTQGASDGFAVLGGSIKAATAALGAFVGIEGLQRLVFASSDAEEALNKVNVVFGDSAGEVRDFAETASMSLGQSEAAALEAAGTFGNLFTATGLAADQAADLSIEIVTLASDLASFNNIDPSEALIKLRAGLVGEFEPLRTLGITLSAATVEAKAFELGLADASGELTEAAKLQARYQLIVEQSTNAQGDFARTSDSLANQIRILKAQFEDVLQAAGAPLVSPLLSLLQEFAPVAEEASAAFGAIAAAVLPAVEALVADAGPALSEFTEAITATSVELAPALLDVGTALGEILAAFTPVIEAVGVLTTGIARAVSIVSEFGGGNGLLIVLGGSLAAAATAFTVTAVAAGGLSAAFATAQVAVLTFFTAIAANPIGALAVGLAAVAAALGVLTVAADDSDERAAEFATTMRRTEEAMFSTAEGVDELRDALASFDEDFAEFIARQSTFAQDPDLLGALNRMDIGTGELEKQLRSLDEGLRDFVATGVEAGEIDIRTFDPQTGDWVKANADAVRDYDGSITDLLNSERTKLESGRDLIQNFRDQQSALEEQARLELEAIAVTGEYTQSQLDAAYAAGIQTTTVAGQETQTLSYLATLEALLATQQASTEAVENSTSVTSFSATEWAVFASAVATGDLNMQNAAASADALGLDAETMTTFVRDATTAIDTFVQTIVDKIPTASEVFQRLPEESNIRDFTTALNESTTSALTFFQNVQTIGAQGFEEFAAFLLEQGPEAGAAFAQEFLNSSDKVKQAAEDALEVKKAADEQIAQSIRDQIPENEQALREFAQAGTKSFAVELDFAGVTEDEINKAMTVYDYAGAEFVDTTREAGNRVGAALSLGLAAGIADTSWEVKQAARDAVKDAEKAAREEAESNSPSRLFARIGGDLASGMAEGMNTAQSLVTGAGAGLVTGGATGALSVPAAAGAATDNSIQMGGIVIHVTAAPGVTRTDAEAQGAGFAAGFARQMQTELRARIGR